MSTKILKKESQQESNVVHGDLTVTGDCQGPWFSKILTDLDTVKVLGGTAKAPLPTSATFLPINTGLGVGNTVPAGGTWLLWFEGFSSVGTLNYGATVNFVGGGSVTPPANASYNWQGWEWKIIASPPEFIDFSRPIYVRHGLYQGDTGGPDTYVVTLGADPYHAIPGHATFDRIKQYLAEHPEVIVQPEPAPVFAQKMWSQSND